MRKPAAVPASPGNADAIESAFYEALRSGDTDKLMACWSDEDEICCVHPGGARLIGPAAIRGAFEAMLAQGGLQVQPLKVRRLQSLGASVHSLVERIEVQTAEGPRHAHVVATNVYHLTPQGWRMVAHHASAGTLAALQDAAEAPVTLH